MALRLRRGTDAERVTITPQAGELIYVIDTKKVWVGDGLTQGGVPVDSTLGSLTLNDLTDVDTVSTPPQNGEALVWNSVDSEWQPQPVVLFETPESDPTVNGNLKVNIVGTDSTLLVDSDNNVLRGELQGNVDGDLLGSVFGDDSTLLVDGVNKKFYGEIISTRISQFNVITGDGGRIEVQNLVNGDSRADIIGNVGRGIISLTYRDTAQDLSTHVGDFGALWFARDDINGFSVLSGVAGGETALTVFKNNTYIALTDNGLIGVNNSTPTVAFDVAGDIKSTGFIQFGSLTSTQRDALTAVNGMVIYNTTNNKFEGYQNGAWINLDDGLPATA